jgi:aspartate carbamoyltransferase catalytic subunit
MLNYQGHIMTHPLYQKDIVSINDLSLDQIEHILAMAKHFKQHPNHDLLKDKIVANCFFEPSTRTRLSFEAAALRLGAKIIGFSSDESLSTQKGETLIDTIRVISDYSDLIVIRHPQEGAARLAAEVSKKPIVNAGDGANQHPTQALVDLFTIQESQNKVEGLHIALVGDLKYGRTIHSLTQLCMRFDVRLYLVSPEALTLPDYICDNLKKQGVRFSLHPSLEDVMPRVDILYMTRLQKERLDEGEYQLFKNKYILTPELLKKAKPNLKILHPLPRVEEINIHVDKTPYAYYFEQAANGVPVRQAILTTLLSEVGV